MGLAAALKSTAYNVAVMPVNRDFVEVGFLPLDGSSSFEYFDIGEGLICRKTL